MVPLKAMRMPKAWPVAANALNDQLDWGAQAQCALSL